MAPQVLMVRLTENCNVGCFMCRFAHRKGEKYIDLDEIAEIREAIKDSGIRLVRFTGGETLMHRQLPALIQGFHADGLKTSIITNGFLLSRRYEEIIDAGLDQVIVSLDGSTPEMHNTLRDAPGLFEKATEAIALIKQNKPQTLLRVNTVVSPHNIEQLNDILDLLVRLDVDQWSIIPLKASEQIWHEGNQEALLRNYAIFQQRTQGLQKPFLLGYSAQWAGRDEAELHNFIKLNRPFTPRGICHLVDQVRFATETVAPCNAASYRVDRLGIELDEGFNLDSANEAANWLRENGPKNCTGCEPINAYLGENPNALSENIFAW